MTFSEALDIVKKAVSCSGIALDINKYDGVIVKSLAATNTLIDRGSSNQTHIAITTKQMNLFPYLYSDAYFNQGVNELKQYFVLKVPVLLYRKNVSYLNSQSDITFIGDTLSTNTSLCRSKRENDQVQLQLSILKYDGDDFIQFRKLFHKNDYLVVLKHQNEFQYTVLGIKEVDADSLKQLNGLFFANARSHTTVSLNEFPLEYNQANTGCNILLYGVPGAGKSWYVEHNIKPMYGNNSRRIVFHPDYTYTDFVGQILPTIKEKNGESYVSYAFSEGPFTAIMKEAHDNQGKRFTLIIEEINRGNAPAIFGDAFQLLDRFEEDTDEYPAGTSKYGIYNSDMANFIYGDPQMEIRIPSNLTIVGTMNTSDQNVFTLDTAFKRRWQMKCIKNDIKNCQYQCNSVCGSSTTWGTFVTVVNNLIIEGNEGYIGAEDKRIGAFFASKDELASKELFGEKVLMYLWNDALKNRHDLIFNPKYKTLEDLLNDFTEIGLMVLSDNCKQRLSDQKSRSFSDEESSTEG